ncbi:Riboflavin kinase / FAD synthetase [Sesbania bispinosa]|nr:Riboflavin kinase / FAD synthetase [Sesbania bispinosa]
MFPPYLSKKTCILGYFRPGVTAGKAAEMEVVVVPSLPKVEGTLPINPWYIGGPVIKGFGRGSK